MAYAPPPPRFTPDDEMRRYLLGQGPAARMPGMPMAPSAPAAMPPAPVAPMPPERSAAVAPPAVELPTTPTVPGIQTPQAPAAPVPGAPPARSPVQPKVPPAVAVYAAKLAEMGNQPPKMPARPRGQGIGELGAAIASGMSGRPYDAGYFRGLDADRERKHKEDIAKFEADQAKQLTATEADSTSQRSRQAQQRMAPLLKQLGLSDEEIATLSAADISGMAKGGNIATTIAEARAKAKAAQEKAAADAAETREKRAYEEKENDRRSVRDAAEQERIARIQFGAGTERAVEQALLQDKLQRERSAELLAQQAAQHDTDKEKEAHRGREAEVQKAEAAEATEETLLKSLQARLEAREKADAKLPNQGVAEQTTNRIKGQLFGGSGMSDEDTRLDNDLDKMGLLTYRNVAANAPNSVKEQLLSGQFFRGNGTTTSAINAVKQRLEEMHQTQQARRAALGVTPTEGKAKSDGPAAPKPEAAPKPAPTAARTPPQPGMKLVQAKGGKPRWLTPEQLQQAVADGVEVEELQ